MAVDQGRVILVTGATGLQGGAVARSLLSNRWRVRALTRNSESKPAKALAALGAEVVQGDMSLPETLDPIFEGIYGVYSVQNPYISGGEGEIRQGKNVAEAPRRAGVQHLIYASAGTGERGIGIPSWETKLVIEDHLKSLGVPCTILRPMAFMELMIEKKFFPSVAAWQVMPALMGSSRKLVWISTQDIGIITAKAFAAPASFTGTELKLASDVQSIDECRKIYREVMGKQPPRFPLPVWIFERFGFVGEDLSKMWRWLRTANLDLDTTATLAVHPEALSVRSWLEKQKKAI